MKTERLNDDQIQITMSKAEAQGCLQDLEQGEENWLDRIKDGLEDALTDEEKGIEEEEDDWDDEEDSDFESLNDDDDED